VSTNYPFSLDSYTQNFSEATDQSLVHAPHHNNIAAAIAAIEGDTRNGWGWRNVMHFGTAGVTGVAGHDSTAAVQAAINSLSSTGGTVLFPPGTYEITQVTIPAVEIQFQGFGAATLFHRTGGPSIMLTNATSTVSAQFTMEDLTIDGNKGTMTATTGGGGTGTGVIYNGQPETANTIFLTLGAGATFRNCRFQNWRHHALDLLGASSRILIENCTFANGAEWGGTTGTDTTPLRFETNTQTTYEAAVTNCSFEHPTPTVVGYQPGGIIIDAQGTNPPVRAVIMGCRFKNLGCRVSGTTVGSIYIYKAADGSSVTNCVFDTPYFTAIAVQNSSNFVIQNNRASCDTNLASAHVYSWQANERANNLQQYRLTFDSNIIQGGGATSEGIYVDSSGATTWPATNVIISNNHIQNVQNGVLLANIAGTASVHNNVFTDLTQVGYGNALRIAGARTTSTGTIVFRGNYCENLISNPVGMDDVAYPTLTVRVEDNTFKNVADNDAGLQFRGIEMAVVRNNRWRGTPTSGSIMTFGTTTNGVANAVVEGNVSDTLSIITRTNVSNISVRRNSWQDSGDTRTFEYFGGATNQSLTLQTAAWNNYLSWVSSNNGGYCTFGPYLYQHLPSLTGIPSYGGIMGAGYATILQIDSTVTGHGIGNHISTNGTTDPNGIMGRYAHFWLDMSQISPATVNASGLRTTAGTQDGVHIETNPTSASGALNANGLTAERFAFDHDNNSIFQNVFVYCAPRDGFSFTGLGENITNGVRSYCNGRYGLLTTFDHFATDVSVGGNGDHGIYVNGSGSVRLHGCKSWYSGQLTNGHGFYIRNITNGAVVLAACEAQDNKGSAYSLDTIVGPVVIQGTADSNSTQSAGTSPAVDVWNTNGAIIDVGCVERQVAAPTQTHALRIRSTSVNNKIRLTHRGENGAVVSTPLDTGSDFTLSKTNDISINSYGARNPATFAASFTPDPTAGNSIAITLTAAITINAPTAGTYWPGARLKFVLTQDATGGRTITWNAVYKTPPAATTTASTNTIAVYEYDGTNWRLESFRTGDA
jgi:Right handed beta helix region